MNGRNRIALFILVGAAAALVGACAEGEKFVGGGAGGEDDSSTSQGPSTSGTGGAGGAATASVSTTATTSAATTVTTSVSTTVTTTAGSGPLVIGAACVSDAQCGAGGKCMIEGVYDAILGGSPAGGYCTALCTTDSDCPSGTCLDDGGGTGECFLDCTVGPALQFLDDALDTSKCHGREDVRCTPVTGGEEICLPTCGSDSQCGAGRVCDPRLTVCVDAATVSTGLPEGSTCDPLASTPDCAGTCVTFSDDLTTCSQSCVLAGELDGDDCGGLAGGLCVFTPAGNGAGDYAFCAKACDAQSGCENPNFWCFAIDGITDFYVDNGYCFGSTACPGGQADCTAGSGDVCTQTVHGPFCLDTQFP